MASIVKDISHDGDYLHLPSVGKEDADDYTDLPSQEEEEEEEEDEEEEEEEEQEEEEEEVEEDGLEYVRPEDFLAFVLSMDRTGYILADRIEAQDAAASTPDATPSIGVVGASDDSELGRAVAEALETVEAPSDGRDCPICLQDDDTAAWKETPCGHRFHGRCVERWLQAKGSCPMCRSQLVATIPTAAATSTAPEIEPSVFLDFYDRVIASSALTEED